MRNYDELNRRFGIASQVCFKQLNNGIVLVEINNSLATATISLQGGHVIKWWPKHQSTPVLWISKLAKFIPGKAIRGGVPICWPWFGAHPIDKNLPGHGYARISPWAVNSLRTLGCGVTEIKLTLLETDLSSAHWPYSVSLTVTISVGRTLTIELETTNNSNQEITLSEGLHTYFHISDIANISVLGLDGCEYVDLISDNIQRKQVGAIRFDGELGRIYVNTNGTCVIEDPQLNRRIRIEKTGSLSTAVWSPWEATATKMDDLGANGWRDMVCVESANAIGNLVAVSPGASHTLVSIYSVESILPSAVSTTA
jgi:glucose-6-phosphate 1-epimerase